nr:hypothetical protein [Providencia rettgeri]
MVKKQDIEHFNPEKYYPPFDAAKTIVIDGKEVKLLECETDTSYLNEPPHDLTELSLLSPFDHLISDALSYNVSLQLVDKIRPSWPMRIVEWVMIPDLLKDAIKRQKETEKYLSDSLTASPERRAALIRVSRLISDVRLSMMSPDAQETIRKAFALMTSTHAHRDW